MTTPILELDGVVGGYGAMTILNGTSFAVKRGAITTVIGLSEVASSGPNTGPRAARTLAPFRAMTVSGMLILFVTFCTD